MLRCVFTDTLMGRFATSRHPILKLRSVWLRPTFTSSTRSKTVNIFAGGPPILFEWGPVLFFTAWASQTHKFNLFYAGGRMPSSRICVTSPASLSSKTARSPTYLSCPILFKKLRTTLDLHMHGIIFFSFSFFHPPAPETIWRTSSGRTILVLPYQHSLTGSDQSHSTWWVCARELSRNSFSS